MINMNKLKEEEKNDNQTWLNQIIFFSWSHINSTSIHIDQSRVTQHTVPHVELSGRVVMTSRHHVMTSWHHYHYCDLYHNLDMGEGLKNLYEGFWRFFLGRSISPKVFLLEPSQPKVFEGFYDPIHRNNVFRRCFLRFFGPNPSIRCF